MWLRVGSYCFANWMIFYFQMKEGDQISNKTTKEEHHHSRARFIIRFFLPRFTPFGSKPIGAGSTIGHAASHDLPHGRTHRLRRHPARVRVGALGAAIARREKMDAASWH